MMMVVMGMMTVSVMTSGGNNDSGGREGEGLGDHGIDDDDDEGNGVEEPMVTVSVTLPVSMYEHDRAVASMLLVMYTA